MLEIPFLAELRAECMREGVLRIKRKYILEALEARFGVAALELERLLNEIDEGHLDDLHKLAVTCRSLASFRKEL
jgi:hypothetical protein